MARWTNDLVLDAALDYVADTDLICICEGQPTTFTEATVTNNLASIGITSGCYTKADGASGRKATLAVSGGTVSTSGSANYMAVVKSSTSALVYIWTLTEQYLTAANTNTTPELYAEIQDPTAP